MRNKGVLTCAFICHILLFKDGVLCKDLIKATFFKALSSIGQEGADLNSDTIVNQTASGLHLTAATRHTCLKTGTDETGCPA